jgi:hypothetical protein
VTIIDSPGQPSAFTVRRQKGLQIVLSDPDNTADPVHDQIAAFDPPVDRSGGDAEKLCEFADREELDLIVAMTATAGAAKTSSFLIAVAGGVSSRGHAMLM